MRSRLTLEERITAGVWGQDWRDTERELMEIWLSQPETFESLIEPRDVAHVPYAGDLANVKRFAERWRADRAFREALPADPYGVAARYGLPCDPEELRFLWDEAFAASRDGDWIAPLVVQRYHLFTREKLLHREKLRAVECVPSDERHRRWRARQIKRTLAHLGPRHHDGIIHAPFAIELSDGCSVGCWFCGVSAGRKRGDFLYTPDNARLWRDVLAVLRRAVGPAAASGFCYWATDPLDNPDYERAAFTAEELLHCEIVSQNPEAVHIQGNAGRARGSERLARTARGHGLGAIDWRQVPGTIACVSGFLLNMVERRVRLVTPCPASDRWPDGYWVLDDARFGDADDLERLIDRMMDRAMPVSLGPGEAARFRPDLTFRPIEAGFELVGVGATSRLEGAPIVQEIGRAVAAGDHTVGEILGELAARDGRAPDSARRLLDQIFEGGFLDEEPRG